MSPAKRIILNTVVSYGRTLFGMALGLFSSRWVFNGLGKEDFGMFGVVGGIIIFVSLLNDLLSGSVSRYYAYSIGEAKNLPEDKGTDLLLRWFNAAFSIHAILPIILIIIGYPVGIYAIENWLVIPDGRLEACVWVFRISLLMAFINMISVPYIAMYRAKQLIAELSIWGMVTAITNFGIAYWMLSYRGDRFIAYAVLSAITPSVILAIQVYSAWRQFGVCHIRVQYLFDFSYIRRIFVFAFGDFFGWIGGTVRDNGAVFVINRYYGSSLNAAYTLSQRVISYTTSLSTALLGALQPAVTTAVGEGREGDARKLSFRCDKFSAMLILLFAVPLITEMDYVLKLWLKDPPEYTASFCRWILAALIIQKLAWGHHIAVLAMGRIVAFQMVLGITAASGVVILIILCMAGFGPLSVGYMILIVFSIMTIERVIFAKFLVKMSIGYWIRKVLWPIALLFLSVAITANLVKYMFCESLWRVLLVSASSALIWLLVSRVVCLDSDELVFVRERVLGKIFCFRRREGVIA